MHYYCLVMSCQYLLVIYLSVIENSAMATRSEAAVRDAENRRKRLRQWIDEHFSNQAAFVAAHNLNQGEISSLLKDKSFGSVKARNLEAATGMPERYLEERAETASPVARPSELWQGQVPPPGTPIPDSSFRKIWVVGKGSGGFLPERIWCDSDHPVGATDSFAELGSSDPNAFLSEVVGQSMYPKYENKNFALIEPNTPIDIEDCVLVRLESGETLLKRLISRRGGSITLGSFNDNGLLHFEDDDVTWMYYAAHEVPRKKIKNRF